jgi:hypothetical protein
MYNPKSFKSEEFISHEEVVETLEYAEKNKSNPQLIGSIICTFISIKLLCKWLPLLSLS